MKFAKAFAVGFGFWSIIYAIFFTVLWLMGALDPSTTVLQMAAPAAVVAIMMALIYAVACVTVGPPFRRTQGQ